MVRIEFLECFEEKKRGNQINNDIALVWTFGLVNASTFFFSCYCSTFIRVQVQADYGTIIHLGSRVLYSPCSSSWVHKDTSCRRSRRWCNNCHNLFVWENIPNLWMGASNENWDDFEWQVRFTIRLDLSKTRVLTNPEWSMEKSASHISKKNRNSPPHPRHRVCGFYF